MPRPKRVCPAGGVFYAINRAVARSRAGWSARQSAQRIDRLETAPLYHTLVHVGAEQAACVLQTGTAENDQAVVVAIWGPFSTRDVHSVSLTPSGDVAIGDQLTYWMGSPVQVSDSAQLLADGDSTCGSWAYSYAEVIAAQGLAVSVWKVTPSYAPQVGSPDELLLINAWNMPDPGSINYLAGYHWRIGTWTQGNPPTTPHVTVIQQTIAGATIDAWELNGIAGQGNPNPPAWFADHAIVRFGDAWYDPSYGGGAFASANAWEQWAIAGFATRADPTVITPIPSSDR